MRQLVGCWFHFQFVQVHMWCESMVGNIVAMWVNCESMWRCHCISVLLCTCITICQTSNPKLFMTYIRSSFLWFHSWGFHTRKYPFAFCFNTNSIQIGSPTANLLQVVGSRLGFLTISTLVFNNLYCIQLRLRPSPLVLPLPLAFGVFGNKLWQSHNMSSMFLFIYLFFQLLF